MRSDERHSDMSALTTYIASPDCREEVKAAHHCRSGGTCTECPNPEKFCDGMDLAALNALCEELHERDMAEGYLTQRAEDAEARCRELESDPHKGQWHRKFDQAQGRVEELEAENEWLRDYLCAAIRRSRIWCHASKRQERRDHFGMCSGCDKWKAYAHEGVDASTRDAAIRATCIAERGASMGLDGDSLYAMAMERERGWSEQEAKP